MSSINQLSTKVDNMFKDLEALKASKPLRLLEAQTRTIVALRSALKKRDWQIESLKQSVKAASRCIKNQKDQMARRDVTLKTLTSELLTSLCDNAEAESRIRALEALPRSSAPSCLTSSSSAASDEEARGGPLDHALRRGGCRCEPARAAASAAFALLTTTLGAPRSHPRQRTLET